MSPSSQLGEPLWTDPGLNIDVGELISTNKKRTRELIVEPSPQSPRKQGKGHHQRLATVSRLRVLIGYCGLSLKSRRLINQDTALSGQRTRTWLLLHLSP